MSQESNVSKPIVEFCKKYHMYNHISRAELIDYLVNYDYQPEGQTDGYDWLSIDPPGTWSEISLAINLGYIDENIYEEVFNIRHKITDNTERE